MKLTTMCGCSNRSSFLKGESINVVTWRSWGIHWACNFSSPPNDMFIYLNCGGPMARTQMSFQSGNMCTPQMQPFHIHKIDPKIVSCSHVYAKIYPSNAHVTLHLILNGKGKDSTFIPLFALPLLQSSSYVQHQCHLDISSFGLCLHQSNTQSLLKDLTNIPIFQLEVRVKSYIFHIRTCPLMLNAPFVNWNLD